MSLSAPAQLTLGFAENGTKNAIPNASQIGITPGAASFNDGFPPVTRQPVAAGGTPPFGEDMNGILFAVSKALQWEQAGGRYVFSSAFATAVGGYPLSGVVQSSDGFGSWLNTTANNTNDPEAVAAPNGWQPVGHRAITSVALSNANVTLTNLQSARETIAFTGPLTANIVVTVAAFIKDFKFVNQTTGAFTVSVKTSGGAALNVPQGGKLDAYGDGATLNSYASAIASGVAGSVRNLLMNVAAASATGTITADEIIVESALGGVGTKLPNFNKTINLAVTGVGGMDTGSAPISGYVAIYAFYNPSAALSATNPCLVATNATSVNTGNIYSGANAPAGYTQNALVSIRATNASGQFATGVQRDRHVGINGASTAFATSATAASPTSFSIAGKVPPGAVKTYGSIGCSSTAGPSGMSLQILADTNFTDLQQYTGAVTNSVTFYINFICTILTAQTLFYTATNGAGTPSFSVVISGYDF